MGRHSLIQVAKKPEDDRAVAFLASQPSGNDGIARLIGNALGRAGAAGAWRFHAPILPCAIAAVYIVAAMIYSTTALADETPASPAYVFTEAQVKVIAETAVQKREGAAAEYKKWDDLIADIVKQTQRIQSIPPAMPPKEPDKKP